LCDGTAYTTAAYPALSAVLGSQYNVSGGQVSPPAGQFRVPILVGRVPVGRSTSEPEFNDMGETGGAKSVILTSGQSGLVAHSHTVTVSGTSDPNNVGHDHAQQGTFGTTGQNLDHFHSGTTAANGTHDHSIDVQGMAQQSHAHSSSLLDSVAGKPNPSTGSSVATTQPINNAGSHDHFINTNGTSNDHAHFVTISGSTGGQSANHNHPFSGSGSAATVAAANATQAHDNLQPYIVVTYIIKA
jgi:microcystin-dependent protein